MKKIIYIMTLLLFTCNSEDANDCFQTSGSIIQDVVNVSNFTKILVNKDIELIVKEAPDYKVTIETGENLINDVKVDIIGDQLVLIDNNSCNFVRDFGITKIYVESPNITEIRTSSQYEISSDGVLNYENLTLISEDFIEESEFTVGDFRLTVNTENLVVNSNNISFFYLEGSVENLFVGFYSGTGRFEGENLVAQHIDIYHRGANDMLVNPIQSLTGELRGTGDLISVNEPPIVDVDRIYTGQLFFN